MANTLEIIQDIFYEQEREIGYVDPKLASAKIVNAASFSGIDESFIARQIHKIPTKEYLYDGAYASLDELLKRGDDVSIWTDDYVTRVATSGVTSLRTNLPFDLRKRLGLASGIEKFSLLPQAINDACSSDYKSIVFVDNKEGNLSKASALYAGVNNPLKPDAYFMLVDRSKDAPENVVFPQMRTVIPSIVGSMEAYNEIQRENNQPNDGKVLWFVDFNEVLVDTPEFKQNLPGSVASVLEKYAS